MGGTSQRAAAGEDAVSFDSVLAGATRVTKSIRLCLDGELMHTIERLNEEFVLARQADEAENRDPQAPALAARIVELTEQARAKAVTFTFQSMGRRAWRNLVAEHPPSEEEKARGADFNTDTFPVAAMVMCAVAPTGITTAKLEQLGERLTDQQWDALWLTCHIANTGGADIPLFVDAFATARGTETNSARRVSTAPPAASS